MKFLPKKNNIGLGLAFGFITPAASFLILMALFSVLDESGMFDDVVSMSKMFRERTLSIVSIAINALFMRRYDKWRCTQTMRGIVLPTFLYVVAWIIYFKDIIIP